MKVPRLEIARLDVPRLGLPAMRLRLLVRACFLLLIMATLALALLVLQDEKRRLYQSYQGSFGKTQAEVMARLRHPAGQLALLNPGLQGGAALPAVPLLLPYGALDIDDHHSLRDVLERSGCAARYPDGASMCVGVGTNPFAGNYVYLVGSFAGSPLVGRVPGQLELDAVHRARLTLVGLDAPHHWLAPLEQPGEGEGSLVKARLTGYAEPGAALGPEARPARDFRGWLWQSGGCLNGIGAQPECVRASFFAVRLPMEALPASASAKGQPVWPPPELGRMQARIEIMEPGSDRPVFDSQAQAATRTVSLDSVAQALLPGETLRLQAEGQAGPPLLTLRAPDLAAERSSPWLSQLIRQLPVGQMLALSGEALESTELLATATGSYQVRLTGDVRGIERSLSVVATRLSWFVGGMLAAIALAWLVIEFSLLRRIAALTRRAAAVSYNVARPQVDQRLGQLDVSDLRGKDELGILAGGLADLLQRVNDDVRREHIRVRQERDMWNAVGHEIMSPLQSLMAIHPRPEDSSHRYVQRMQQAVRVLYGTASPSEALAAADLQLGVIDLNEFLRQVAGNAAFAGLDDVRFEPMPGQVWVRADEFSLEDAVTHILRNASRFRTAGSPIALSLAASESVASIRIHNQGPAIEASRLGEIFEYGVSDAPAAEGAAPLHRGQGLYVAKTYMAKMGGTVQVANQDGGVCFTLSLPRLARGAQPVAAQDAA